jgi:hypothetical protein
MRTWLILWLCACLMLASPAHGACCPQAGDGVAAAMAVDADADLPPCHRGPTTKAGQDGDGGGTPPAPGAASADCDHCACPCRLAAMAPPQPADDRAALPDFPPVAVLAGAAEPSRIPPLPPPIA